jgi:hypothetical protein
MLWLKKIKRNCIVYFCSMYIDVVNLIESIAQKVNPTGVFYEGKIADAYLQLESKRFPQIHLYPFTITNVSVNGLDVIPTILIAFLFEDSPHSSNKDRQDIINEADIMQRKFKSWLEYHDVQFDNYKAEPFYKQFNSISSGMFISFSLSIKSDDCKAITV